jgi:hypothetical protein
MNKTIEFTDEEYLSLLVLLEVGNMVTSGEDKSGKMEELTKFILSKAEQFNCGDLAIKKMDISYPSDKLNEMVIPFVESYNELVKNRQE